MRWSGVPSKTFSTSYLPHGYCFLWNKQLLALHIVSDALIFLSYLVISCTLIWFLFQLRRKIPFAWFFVTFGVFILACGFTHAMDILVLWIPLYWLAGEMKAITAVASVITAVALPFLVPRIKALLKDLDSSQKNELRLLGAAESSMDCLYFADALRGVDGEILDFVFTYLNSNAVKLVTLPLEAMLGVGMCELFPINKKIGLFDGYKDVVLTGEPFVGEFKINEETINTAWLRIQAVKLGDGVAITASDITARRRQEEALHRSEKMLDRTEQLCATGGWEYDIMTRQLIWTRETYRILGVGHEEQLTLEDGINFYLPEERPAVRAAIEKAIAEGTGFDMELTIVRRNGRHIPVRLIGTAELADGRPVRLTGAFKDVTGHVGERLALSRANELLTMATESGEIGIWHWDIPHDSLTWDRQMFQLYGMEAQGGCASYAMWKAALHPEDVAATEKALADAIAGIKPYDVEFRIVWADRSVHHIRGTGRVTFDKEGRPARMVGTNRDVAEQYRLAEEAHRISKLEIQLKDEFLSHVSHELRSPLAAIDSFSSIIADGLAGETSPQMDEYLRIILRNSAQLESMIEDLLQVTQAKSGKLRLDLTCVSICEAISDAMHTLQRAAEIKEVHFTSHCPPDLPPSFADSVRLQQILIILCDNAIKFTPSGGTVTVYAEVSSENPRFLVLGVSDTGRGISAGMCERIFEHLYQVKDHLTDTGVAGRKGLGLGLHIAKGLVIRQGGEIGVNSTPGQGSDFRFTVPIFQEVLALSKETAEMAQ